MELEEKQFEAKLDHICMHTGAIDPRLEVILASSTRKKRTLHLSRAVKEAFDDDWDRVEERIPVLVLEIEVGWRNEVTIEAKADERYTHKLLATFIEDFPTRQYSEDEGVLVIEPGGQHVTAIPKYDEEGNMSSLEIYNMYEDISLILNTVKHLVKKIFFGDTTRGG